MKVTGLGVIVWSLTLLLLFPFFVFWITVAASMISNYFGAEFGPSGSSSVGTPS